MKDIKLEAIADRTKLPGQDRLQAFIHNRKLASSSYLSSSYSLEKCKDKGPLLTRACLKAFKRNLCHLCLLCSFRLFHNLAVKEMDGALSMLGKARIVRHHADGCTFTMQALQQFHHGFAVA